MQFEMGLAVAKRQLGLLEKMSAKYCTNANHEAVPILQPKTISEKFAESMMTMAAKTASMKTMAAKQSDEKSVPRRETSSSSERDDWTLLKPNDGYTSRFQYNGYVKKCHWVFYDNGQKSAKMPETDVQYNYRMLKKRKFCILMGFAGQKYNGMAYNSTRNTIEDNLFIAMAKNRWILDEHIAKPALIDFEHGSRTDRGVSAVRMNISLILPNDVRIDDLNRDLPPDIRVFAMKPTTPKFSARFSCSGRTYSYTLPTVAFAHYNDQTEMKDYRISSDRLQRANDILRIYLGHTNFHNYTEKKLHFDPTSKRHIRAIQCCHPFIDHGVEFTRIEITGSSFMLHQIRRMVGFSLAVIRGIVEDELLRRSLTNEKIHTPTAPGLGLMLERLHYSNYAERFKAHDPLTFEDCDEDVDKFRSEQIHPIIVETEIKQQSMVEWLQLLLCNHSFEATLSRENEDEWGEDKEFLKKLQTYSEQ